MVETNLEVAISPPKSLTLRSTEEDYRSFLRRPARLVHQTITSATTGTTIITDDLIASIFNSSVTSVSLLKKFSNFMSVEADIVLSFVTQGQPFASGKVVYSACPLPRFQIGTVASVTDFPELTDYQWPTLPHVDLDPGATTTHELRLPNCSPTGRYTVKSTEEMGSYQLRRTIVNNLISGTSVAPTFSVCVYMWLENVRFSGVTFTALSSNVLIEEKRPGGLLSQMFEGISKSTASMRPMFPAASVELSLFSQLASSASQALSYFGYSKPQQLENRAEVLNRHVDNWSHVDGASTALVLGDTQAPKLSINPMIACGPPDDMLISHVCSKPGLAGTLPITPATAAGTLAWSVYLSPTTCAGSAVQYTPTPLAGTAICFEYWAGDLTVTFEIIATIFHRLTLMVAWEPNINAALPTSINEAFALQHTLIEVSGRTKATVTCPMTTTDLLLRVPEFSANAFVTDPNRDSTLGKLYVYVVNPLTSNGSTDNIAVNYYFHSDNIRFYGPSTEKIRDLKYQIDALASNEVIFGTKTDLSKYDYITFGRSVNSFKELASKLSLAQYEIVSVSTLSPNSFIGFSAPFVPAKLIDLVSPSGTEPSTSLLNWVGQGFLGYRGSIRYMFFAEDTLATSVVDSNYLSLINTVTNISYNGNDDLLLSSNNFYPLIYDANAVTASTKDVSPAHDVVVSYQQPFSYVSFRNIWSQLRNNLQVFTGVRTPTANGEIEMTLLNGAGDDATFIWFLGWPPVRY